MYLAPNILISIINLIIFTNLSFNSTWVITILVFNILSVASIRYYLSKILKI